ncbi:hypothetical protein P7H06_00925 [Paenibacillus larvae]|nr:hypothetical protein [Paenibacillus larvae]MDT2258425.1 hypothetical protein [Paenibacillus larvae]
MFRSLFAFGLGELQELRTLQSEELSGYLYSAGLGLSGSAIIAAGRKLNQDMDQLYKPRGKNQLVNQGLIMWDELRLKIRKVKEHLEQYDEWNNELSELEESIVRAEEEYKEISRETEWIQLCLKIRPSWLRLKQIDRQLNEFPPLRAFPRHAVTRWESCRKKLTISLPGFAIAHPNGIRCVPRLCPYQSGRNRGMKSSWNGWPGRA